MHQPIRDHQIEQILLSAHTEREAGVDLIEEYFMGSTSLDEITKYAQILLSQNTDPKIQEVIVKNLSECIVVKMQTENRSFMGFFRKIFAKLGWDFKNGEIERAEKLIRKVLPPSSSHSLSEDAFATECDE